MTLPRICLLATAAALPAVLGAQAVAERPAYARLSAVIPMDNFKSYLGAKAPAQALELGYDFSGPDEWAGLGVHLTYLNAAGSSIEKYGGLQQSLRGWRLGGDVRLKTPVKDLTAFAGITVSKYRGRRDAAGVLPNYDAPASPFRVPAGDYPETQTKFGARAGVEYRINAAWGVALDYSFSEWRSDYQINSYTPGTGSRTMDGVNPLNPSWIALSAQYRWSFGK